MQVIKFARNMGATLVVSSAILVIPQQATANQKLDSLSKKNTNWAMQTKDYGSTHYSEMYQINIQNVHKLKPVWSFSTGVLNGHEGGPLVVDGIMYVHSPFPNNIFALDLNEPDKILWEYKPKQNPAARAVACCEATENMVSLPPPMTVTGVDPLYFFGKLNTIESR